MPAKNNESRDGEFYINGKPFKFSKMTIVPHDDPEEIIPLKDDDRGVVEHKLTFEGEIRSGASMVHPQQKLIDRVASDTVVTAIHRRIMPPDVLKNFDEFFGESDYFVCIPADWILGSPTQIIMYPQSSEMFAFLMGKTKEECQRWARDAFGI